MNIGIVTAWFDRGAGYVSKTYEKILSKENNVFIYARGGEKIGKGDPFWDKDNVYWGKRVYNGIPMYIDKKDFVKRINKYNIELLLFNEQQSWDIVIFIKNKYPNIIIGSYIDYYTKKTVKFFDVYDYLICNTQRHYSVFQYHPKVFYFKWGVDINLYKPQNKQKFVDELCFFHSSGLSNRKGTDILVKVFNKFNEEGIKLIIHSQYPIAAYNSTVRNIIKKNKNIIFINKTIKPPGLYYMGDVYVYPTKLEGIGLTILEACSCGLPVIVPNNGPMNEFVENGINGQLVDIYEFKKRSDGYYWDECYVDEDDLYKKMRYYYDNKEKLCDLKLKARKYAENKLDIFKNSLGLNSFLNNLKSKRVEKSLQIEIISYEKDKYSKYIYFGFIRHLIISFLIKVKLLNAIILLKKKLKF